MALPHEHARPANNRGRDRLAAVGIGLIGSCAPLVGPAAQAQGVPAESDVVLSELNVTGAGPGIETATSPVIGYRATRSGTGTRTDTALRDTPQSINVVPREVLTDRQDRRLTDAVTNVSTVQPGSTVQGR